MRKARPPRMFVSGGEDGKCKSTSPRRLPLAIHIYYSSPARRPTTRHITFPTPRYVCLLNFLPTQSFAVHPPCLHHESVCQDTYGLFCSSFLTTALPLNAFSIFLALYFCTSFLCNCLWPSTLDRYLPVMLFDAIPGTLDLFWSALSCFFFLTSYLHCGFASSFLFLDHSPR